MVDYKMLNGKKVATSASDVKTGIDNEFDRTKNGKSIWQYKTKDANGNFIYEDAAIRQYYVKNPTDLIDILMDNTIWHGTGFDSYHARLRFLDRIILEEDVGNFDKLGTEIDGIYTIKTDDIRKKVQNFKKSIRRFPIKIC